MRPLLVLAGVGLLYAQGPRHYPSVRLRPSAFPELPKDVATELVRRGCRIPQPNTERRENVIQGAFTRAGQTDWAVLCSARGISSILVFRNGSAEDIAAAARFQDPDDSAIYDHVIFPRGRKYIMEHYRAYGGPKPPPIDHQGIESGGEKASVILYFYRGKWLTLQGAD